MFQSHEAMRGTNEVMLSSHLDEFMWRKEHGKTPMDALTTSNNGILLHKQSLNDYLEPPAAHGYTCRTSDLDWYNKPP
ncbi:hypothetical protein PoB_003526300 [Plakobranchus ocellatus]|uniref:Uncharacterized protein n=1 Tax=Plakobranchus ocellatus TaxID=259542 RepID=A0AAV4AQB7_9GAST|nr:hypothetical protein PoB_003526300 [Plakobranchus ocellatus]